MKRVLSFLLVISLVLSMLTCPIAVKADESGDEILTAGECGSNVSWTLEDGVLTISGDGEIDYGSIGWRKTEVTKVVIEEGVTGSISFEYYDYMESISIPSTITDLKSYAFANCHYLEEITLPEGISVIPTRAFLDCYNLKRVNLPSDVTEIGERAFAGCRSLENIELPNNLQIIGDAVFTECYNLLSIYIPANVRQIGSIKFDSCNRLSSIVVDGENDVFDSRDNCNAIIESATNTLVAGCKDTVIPESVEKIGDFAFYECRELESIEIPNSVTDIGKCAFFECKKLTNIIWSKKLVNIGDRCFFQCFELEDFNLPDSVEYIGDECFTTCRQLTYFVVPAKVKKIGSRTFELCNLTNITIPRGVTDIESMAFSGCYGLTDVYYESTEEYWNNISIAGGNNCLTDANIHFISTNEEKNIENKISEYSSTSTNIKWTPVTFSVYYPADGQPLVPMKIRWGYDLFDMSPLGGLYTTGYDNRLAIASAVIAQSTYDKNLAYTVFDQLKINDYYCDSNYDSQLMNQPATCMGYTQASIGGITKNLYVVAIRGTNSLEDLGTDAGAWMQAFEPSAEYVKNKFNSFVDSVKNQIPESSGFDNVVLITGHSLGGAVAGRLTEMLSSDSRFSPSNTFCYTFAAPRWTYSHTDQLYRNIKNIVNGDDVVPAQKFSASYRNGVDIKFYPTQISNFESRFAAVTKGRNYENIASWNFIGTGGNVYDAAIMVKHQMDTYMSYLLCEYQAEELWEYEIGLIRRVSARCPVDVEVIDSHGDVVAKVENNKVIKTSLRVETVVEGDEKFFYFYDKDEYKINLVGNDKGAMTLSFEDINPETSDTVMVKEYSNVVLENGKKLLSSTVMIQRII